MSNACIECSRNGCKRRAILSIDDILDLPPSKKQQCCKYSRKSRTETRPRFDHQYNGDFLQQSRCSLEGPTLAPWQSSTYITGCRSSFGKANQYLQQYHMAYGSYARQLYMRSPYIRQQRKRMRASFTHEQVLKLQRVFQTKKYLGNTERTELAKKLDMTEQQIKIWFQNRRYKEKKQNCRDEKEMGRVDIRNADLTEDDISKDNFVSPGALDGSELI